MPRRSLEFQPNRYYHLYNRGNNQQLIFFEPENYCHFLRLLRHHFITPRILDVVAYCLMPNHYHLLVQLKTEQLSKGMQAMGLAYTKAINKRYQRVGSVFQGRFQAIEVDTSEYLLHLSRYIHLNPVKAGLVEQAEDWAYSSYPEYVAKRNGTLPQMQVIEQMLTKQRYQEFVELEAVARVTGLEPLLLD